MGTVKEREDRIPFQCEAWLQTEELCDNELRFWIGNNKDRIEPITLS